MLTSKHAIVEDRVLSFLVLTSLKQSRPANENLADNPVCHALQVKLDLVLIFSFFPFACFIPCSHPQILHGERDKRGRRREEYFLSKELADVDFGFSFVGIAAGKICGPKVWI